MAMSSTTLGDDDGSVDTLNTADTPTTIGSRNSRNSRPREQRARSGKVSPAAAVAAAGAGPGLEADAPSWSRRAKAPSRNGTATAAAAAAGAPPEDAKTTTVIAVMPTPPRTEGVNVDTLVVSVKLVSKGGSEVLAPKKAAFWCRSYSKTFKTSRGVPPHNDSLLRQWPSFSARFP